MQDNIDELGEQFQNEYALKSGLLFSCVRGCTHEKSTSGQNLDLGFLINLNEILA